MDQGNNPQLDELCKQLEEWGFSQEETRAVFLSYEDKPTEKEAVKIMNRKRKEEKEKAEKEKEKAEKEKEKAEKEKKELEEKTEKEKRELEERAEKAEGERDFGQDLLEKGLPLLYNTGARSSSSQVPSKFAETAPIKETLVLIEGLPDRIRSKLWNEANNSKYPGFLPFTCEADIQGYTKALIADILRDLATHSQFSFAMHATLSSEFHLPTIKKNDERSDIMVICDKHHRPMGAIEVKTPLVHANLDTTLDEEAAPLKKHLPQLFEYLVTLHFGVGVQHPFGILTNFRVWFFCWLEPANKPAQASTFGFTPWKDIELELEQEGSSNANPWGTERQINVDGPHRWDEAVTVRKLISIVLKMISSPVSPPRADGEGKCFFPLVDRELIKCVRINFPTLKEGELPNVNAQQFYLYRILGQGAEGQTWKAFTEAGSVCALKIFLSPPKRERLEDELNIWEKVWNQKCFAIDYRSPKKPKESPKGEQAEHMFTFGQIPEYCYLIMPLLKVYSEEEAKTLDKSDRELVLKSIEDLARGGYHHQDLRWPNVGFIEVKEKGKIVKRAILFDLHVLHINANDEKAVNEAIKVMKEKLFPPHPQM